MADSEKDPLLGTRIREYEILNILGKGGMGAVYRARHVYLEEERAIKIVQSRLIGDSEFVDRFIREAKILIRLRHPNLIQLFEFGSLEQDAFFMVMEFINGKSVLDRIREVGRIPIEESIRIIREAALGLQHAHQRGIIHRDVSPDNLLLVADEYGVETTKVIDFGIAKPIFDTGSKSQTATNAFVGKLEYCSPEQCGLLEEGEVIDGRSDIYSLAVTLHHMLAGVLPFHASTPQGYILKHANEIPKPVSRHFAPGGFPEALDNLITRALSKRREDRHSSMAEFIRQLDRVDPYPETIDATAEIMSSPIISEFVSGDIFARRYVIQCVLGEGGMGKVYKATDKILGVPVALKTMSTKIAKNPNTLERFKREVIIARKVAHPNVCRIYDIGESENIHYVSMEYLEGRTLSALLRSEGRLAVNQGLNIIKQILHAMYEAHRVGVIHRDLKPQNIMVDPQNRASIMDFGISISLDAERVTQTGVFVGTPHYMAPEQFEEKVIDHRVDIYSLGIIMYEVFTGVLPFHATSPMGVVFAHMKSEPVKPTKLVPNIPAELEKVILKCLEKTPEKRFQNARQALYAIQLLLDSDTTTSTLNKERIVHKLIAERNYSRAIKILNSMVKKKPGNEEWQKLLEIAISEKAKRDYARTRTLLKRRNLIQAQLLIDRIKRRYPKESTIIRKIQAVEVRLIREKDRTAISCLTEAQKRFDSGDWTGALGKAEEALNLKPNDPEIIKIHHEILSRREQEDNTIIGPRLKDVRGLLRQGRKKDAVASLERILKDHPGSLEAIKFREEILRGGGAVLLESEMKQPGKAPGWVAVTEKNQKASPMRKALLIYERLSIHHKVLSVVGIVIVLLLITFWLLWSLGLNPGDVSTAGSKEESVEPSHTQATMAKTPLIVNALPWGTVRLKNLADDHWIEISEKEAITPCYLSVPEGAYLLEVRNDEFKDAISLKINVKGNQANVFNVSFSDYDPKEIAASVVRGK